MPFDGCRRLLFAASLACAADAVEVQSKCEVALAASIAEAASLRAELDKLGALAHVPCSACEPGGRGQDVRSAADTVVRGASFTEVGHFVLGLGLAANGSHTSRSLSNHQEEVLVDDDCAQWGLSSNESRVCSGRFRSRIRSHLEAEASAQVDGNALQRLLTHVGVPWDDALHACDQHMVQCDDLGFGVTLTTVGDPHIPDDVFLGLAHIQHLSIIGGIGGSVPTHLIALPSLEHLYLDLSASLTSSLWLPVATCSIYLATLYVRSAHITGQVPDVVCECGGLTQLSITGATSLTSTIPSCIGRLQGLMKLDLSNSGFAGTIPDAFDALELSTLSLGDTWLTGGIPPSLAESLPVITVLSLDALAFGCMAGTHAPEPQFWAAGAVSCLACNRGTYSEHGAEHFCQRCTPGRFAGLLGESECALCRPGRFSDGWGTSACSACAEGLMTRDEGSVSSEKCMCPAGTRLLASGTCDPCSDGLSCVSGVVPSLRAGYYMRPGSNLSDQSLALFRCLPASACPSSTASGCSPFRTGLACARCKDGYFDAWGIGDCSPCSAWQWITSSGMVLLIVTVVLALVALVAGARCIPGRTAVAKTRYLLTSFGTLVLLMFLTMQVMGVYNLFAISWVRPLHRIIHTASSVAAFYFPMECVIAVSVPMNYRLEVLGFPFAGAVIALVVFVRNICRHADRLFREMKNTLGFGAVVVFTPMCVKAVVPFVCYWHPGGVQSSLLKYPSILCFESEDHKILIFFGVASMLMGPVLFLAICIRAFLSYPSMMVQGNASFVKANRFLFGLAHPESNWYVLAILPRNLVLSLLPALMPENHAGQLLISSAILLISLVFQALHCPWRMDLANYADQAGTLNLALILLCGAASSPPPNDSASFTLLIYGMLVVLAAIIAICLASVCAKFMYASPMYAIFLSHHKKDAQAMARLLQIRLQQRTVRAAPIFLDSDHLVNLDVLFYIVRSRTKNLVLLLTGQVLERPWVVGELATAFFNLVPIIGVRFASFPWGMCNEEEVLNKFDYEASGLARFAITEVMLLSSFRAVLVRSTIKAAHIITDEQVTNIVLMIGDEVKGLAMVSPSSPPVRSGCMRVTTVANLSGDMVLIFDAEDSEAASTVFILRHKLFDHIMGSFVLCSDQDQLANSRRKAGATIVLLSLGFLDRAECVLLVTAVVLKRSQLLPSQIAPENRFAGCDSLVPVMMEGFAVPGPFYYETQLPRTLGSPIRASRAKGGGPLKGLSSVEAVQAAVAVESSFRSLFQLIAVRLSLHASDTELTVQSTQVLLRATSVAEVALQEDAKKDEAWAAAEIQRHWRDYRGRARHDSGPQAVSSALNITATPSLKSMSTDSLLWNVAGAPTMPDFVRTADSETFSKPVQLAVGCLHDEPVKPVQPAIEFLQDEQAEVLDVCMPDMRTSKEEVCASAPLGDRMPLPDPIHDDCGAVEAALGSLFRLVAIRLSLHVSDTELTEQSQRALLRASGVAEVTLRKLAPSTQRVLMRAAGGAEAALRELAMEDESRLS